MNAAQKIDQISRAWSGAIRSSHDQAAEFRAALRRGETITLTDSSWMPFGKFGPGRDNPRRMKEVSSDYLEWFISNCESSEWHDAIVKYKRLRDSK